MTRPIISIGDTNREMNDEEFAELQQRQTDLEKVEELALKVETDKAALLAKLGITADEAKLLLS